MPLVPVPRWLPRPTYTVTRSYLDALPRGWQRYQFPEFFLSPVGYVTWYGGAEHAYAEHCLTQRERQARCILSFAPSGLIGVWQPVPRIQWPALDATRLHLVHAHIPEQVKLNSVQPWQRPQYWAEEQRPATFGGTVSYTRVDWDTTTQQVTGAKTRPARSLEQVFADLGVAFDYHTLPELVPPRDYGIQAFRQEQYQLFLPSAWPHPSGTLFESIGYPADNSGPLLTLLAGERATVGSTGEICFECDQRDIHAVWVHVRNGSPMPTTKEGWAVMQQALADLTAQGG